MERYEISERLSKIEKEIKKWDNVLFENFEFDLYFYQPQGPELMLAYVSNGEISSKKMTKHFIKIFELDNELFSNFENLTLSLPITPEPQFFNYFENLSEFTYTSTFNFQYSNYNLSNVKFLFVHELKFSEKTKDFLTYMPKLKNLLLLKSKAWYSEKISNNYRELNENEFLDLINVNNFSNLKKITFHNNLIYEIT